MKILIAGGAGYVGSVLVPKLLARGYEVDVIDLLWFGNALPDGARLIARDILELGLSDVQGYDQVVFLAGLSNDPMAEYSPGKNFVYNAACPAFLAYLAKQAGVRRYIYASSCSVYGYSVDDLCLEDGATAAQYPYGVSKLQGELGVLLLQDNAFSVIALRKGTVCGYSPRMRFDLVVNTMFKTALTANRITVNNPSIWRPILGIQDATDAYVRAIEADPSISGVFNIASGNFTLGELADYVDSSLREHLGIRATLKIRHVEDIRNYKVDFTKAQRVLGFRPAQGVDRIVRELIEHRAEFGDMNDPKYSNIASFKAIDAAAGTPA
ncbi:MAG: NAD-dependent epimerase/dehydratase family protein [Acidimicrobiales bacterium]